DAVAGVRVALEEVVALGNPQIDELAIVARRLALDVLQGAARLGIPLRPEQNLRAPEIELVVLLDDQILERRQLAAGVRGRVGERELVVDANEGVGGALAIAGSQRGASEARQDLLRRDGLLRRQAFVDLRGAGVIAAALGGLRLADERRHRQI